MVETPKLTTDMDGMAKMQMFMIALLGWIGLVAGALLGFHLAGMLGLLIFAPVGALAGFVIGGLGWQALYLLQIFA